MSNVDLVGVGDVVGGLDLGDSGVVARSNGAKGVSRLDDVGLRSASRRLGSRRRRRGRTASELGDASLGSLVHLNTSVQTVQSTVDDLGGSGDISSVRGAVQVVRLPEPSGGLEGPLGRGNGSGVVDEIVTQGVSGRLVVVTTSELDGSASEVAAATVVVTAPGVRASGVGVLLNGAFHAIKGMEKRMLVPRKVGLERFPEREISGATSF